MAKTFFNCYVNDINYRIDCNCNNAENCCVRKSNEYTEGTKIVFVGSYAECKEYIEKIWLDWQVSIIS